MSKVEMRPFSDSDAGKTKRFFLKNANGMEVSLTDYGATIVSILVPDKNGTFADIVQGYEDVAGYQQRKYCGATVGRCCNRIFRGNAVIEGTPYQLACNDKGKNHLHGGNVGFDAKIWDAQVIQNEHGQAVKFTYVSPDGEENYPGTLQVVLTVSLSEQNELILEYAAQTDKETLCSLTNHSYFNLRGHDAGSICGHRLRLHASRFTMADAESIPTGELLPVAGTPMDFLAFHEIGERIDADFPALKNGHGYDHNWVIDKPRDALAVCAEVYEPESGRQMTCLTTSPCVQFYSANFMKGGPGKGGCIYDVRGGFCLETQYAPDAIHHPDWESPLLRPGERYQHTTIYRFEVRKECDTSD